MKAFAVFFLLNSFVTASEISTAKRSAAAAVEKFLYESEPFLEALKVLDTNDYLVDSIRSSLYRLQDEINYEENATVDMGDLPNNIYQATELFTNKSGLKSFNAAYLKAYNTIRAYNSMVLKEEKELAEQRIRDDRANGREYVWDE